jgi:hypothetical protein
MNDRLHNGDLRVAREGRKARTDYGLARQRPVLLGQSTAGAKPPASGNDYGSNCFRHRGASKQAGGLARHTAFARPRKIPTWLAKIYFGAVQHLT